MGKWRSLRADAFATGCIAAALLAGSALAAPVPQEPTVREIIAAIFDGQIPEEDQAMKIFRDESTNTYYAFYLASYLGTPELRAYMVPFSASTDIQPLLEAGDLDGAFEELVGWMRLDLGARYVSDVNLDGIRDEEVEVGQGQMRDRFHSQLFASHAEADDAYREWLRHVYRLVSS